MSDYDPRPPGTRREPPKDSLRAPEVDPVRVSTSGGFYLVGGVTLALLLVAGLLFFNPAKGPGERTDQASQPERITITPTTPEPTVPTQRPPAQRP